LAEEYRPAGLIVGLPLHMNGDESQKSAEARQFADWLGEILQLPHTFQDERLTSWQAEKLLLTAEFSSRQRKQKIDKLAAQILLQTWLDKRRNTCGGNTDQAASNPSTP
jgi:putative Holliday junction resolvase